MGGITGTNPNAIDTHKVECNNTFWFDYFMIWTKYLIVGNFKENIQQKIQISRQRTSVFPFDSFLFPYMFGSSFVQWFF